MHIKASRITRKPLIIHTRAASEDTIRIMQEEGAGTDQGRRRRRNALLHRIAGSRRRRRMAMGFYISFSGIVTFKSAKDLQAVAREVPLERMLIETDSPYLAPVPFRGRMNEPGYVRHVAEYHRDAQGTCRWTQVAAADNGQFLQPFQRGTVTKLMSILDPAIAVVATCTVLLALASDRAPALIRDSRRGDQLFSRGGDGRCHHGVRACTRHPGQIGRQCHRSAHQRRVGAYPGAARRIEPGGRRAARRCVASDLALKSDRAEHQYGADDGRVQAQPCRPWSRMLAKGAKSSIAPGWSRAALRGRQRRRRAIAARSCSRTRPGHRRGGAGQIPDAADARRARRASSRPCGCCCEAGADTLP